MLCRTSFNKVGLIYAAPTPRAPWGSWSQMITSKELEGVMLHQPKSPRSQKLDTTTLLSGSASAVGPADSPGQPSSMWWLSSLGCFCLVASPSQHRASRLSRGERQLEGCTPALKRLGSEETHHRSDHSILTRTSHVARPSASGAGRHEDRCDQSRPCCQGGGTDWKTTERRDLRPRSLAHPDHSFISLFCTWFWFHLLIGFPVPPAYYFPVF